MVAVECVVTINSTRYAALYSITQTPDSRITPGKLLDYLMLEKEFQLRRFKRIEFCTNAGPELIRWGTRTRSISDISVYRNELGKQVSQVYRKLKRLIP